MTTDTWETPYPAALERFPTLGQSRLATFDRCALSSSFEEDFRKDWSGHPQARGQIFHRFAAECLRAMHRSNEGTIPTDLAVEILQESLRQADVDKDCPRCTRPIVERKAGRIRCAGGHEMRSGFVNLPMSEIKDLRWVCIKWAHENAFDIENLVEVEQMLASTVRYPTPDGGYVERTARGKLDAWFVTGESDEEAIVLDWKDTWDLPAATEVGFDGYFQQRFYAWLIFKNFSQIEKVTLREFYVRFSEPREATVWRSQIEDIDAELAALAERFDRSWQETNFPASPGRHCQVCPRPAECPISPGVRGEGSIMEEETALRYAAEANVARSALKQRVDAMKAWASVHGNIPISDHKGPRVWGYREVTRKSRPDRKTLEEALQHGTGAVDLDALFPVTKGTRFEPHAPQPVEDTADDAALMQALTQSLGEAA